MFSRWVRTVPSDMPRRRAIWVLVCPAASKRSRSQCRGVSWGMGWRRRSASRQAWWRWGRSSVSSARSRSEKSGPDPRNKYSRRVWPGRDRARRGGQGQHQSVFGPQRPVDAAAGADGMPLPGRVEIRDLDDAAQVTGPVWMTAHLTLPVELPVHLRVRNHGLAAVLHELRGPRLLPPAVEAREHDDIAADLAHQVGQQGRRKPLLSRHVGAVLTHDGRQSAQVPFAGCHRSCHRTFPGQPYSDRGDPGIRRTSDGGCRTSLSTLAQGAQSRARQTQYFSSGVAQSLSSGRPLARRRPVLSGRPKFRGRSN